MIGIVVANRQVGVQMTNVEHNRFDEFTVQNMQGFGELLDDLDLAALADGEDGENGAQNF